MTPRPFGRLVALAVALAACSPAPTSSPSPTSAPPSPLPSAEGSASAGPSADADATYRAIAAQVVAIRGLDAPDRVEPAIIDRPTLEKNLAAEFDKDNPAPEIAKAEAIEKILKLLPADASLRDLFVKLQGSQVIGYYDPTAKKLFIVSDSGGLGPLERVTYAHEFTHELQDRQFDLNGLGLNELHDQSDRGLAILSLVEGDAVGVQTAWMIQNLSPAALGEVAAQASDPTMLAVLASMPPILLETSLFPYQAGASFVAALKASGGQAAVDKAFGRPPASSEQILHPEKYAAGEPPIAVTLPADLAGKLGPGTRLAAQDTLGELQLRVWLKENGVPADQARTAAEGWGGDRVGLLNTPGGDVLVLLTAWDTLADAREFKTSAAQALGRFTGAGIYGPGSRVAVVIDPAGGHAGDLDALLQDLVPG